MSDKAFNWLVLSTAWLDDLNIDRSNIDYTYLGNYQCVMGSREWWQFTPFYQSHWLSPLTVFPCTAPTSAFCLLLVLSRTLWKTLIMRYRVMLRLHLSGGPQYLSSTMCSEYAYDIWHACYWMKYFEFGCKLYLKFFNKCAIDNKSTLLEVMAHR